MATYGELIGACLGPDEIAKELEADSINYLPIEEYLEATGMSRVDLCLGCVTGEYPTQMANELSRDMETSIEIGGEENGRIYE
jgi:amidophosphoribosyltransferase